MDRGAPKVSVAMCTYNTQAFVAEQLESILKQTRPPDEIVVCDDRSTDETVKTLTELAAHSPIPVRIIENPKNLGANGNHEKAIRESTGDIIFPSDSDDYWFADRIATTLPLFEKNPATVLLYCDAVLTDRSLNSTGQTLFSKRRFLVDIALPTAQELGRGIQFNGPMMVFRSALKPFLFPFSNQWVWDHWVAFLAYAMGEVGRIDRPLLYYRRHGENRGVDPDLDGGFWYRWQAAKKHSDLKNYVQRRRQWEHMIERLHQIRDGELAPRSSARFDELLSECERCFQFAYAREVQKGKPRLLRAPTAFGHLIRGDYHSHAHGLKSFVQDVLVK